MRWTGRILWNDRRRAISGLRFCLLGYSLFLGFWACQPVERPLQPGFYYWKTYFALDSAQMNYLRAAQVRRLYVKIADIGVQPSTGMVEPYALLRIGDTLAWRQFEIVPCLFFTNETFQTLAPEDAPWLAERVIELLSDYPLQAREVQFDCDWTQGTRAAYFAFLREFRRKMGSNTVVSATIRLHQYHQPTQTGIPPVQRGALMCYNTGHIDQVHETNSILSQPAFDTYLTHGDYPLPLDLILPAYSWLLVYRDDALWKIIPEPASGMLLDSLRFEPLGALWRVKAFTFAGGHYLRPGDLLRYETVAARDLFGLLPQLAQAAPRTGGYLSLYHLDSTALNGFHPGALQQLCDSLPSFYSAD